MALRAREIYYFVRIGNYASRPLRALQADFHKLGAAGDQAATRLERLQVQQRKLMADRAAQVTRSARFVPGGRDFDNMRLKQAQRLSRLQENQRRQLSSVARAEAKLTTLARARYDVETRILRVEQAQAAIATRLRSKKTTPEAAVRLRQMQMINQRRLVSAGARLQENVGDIGTTNAHIANQKRLFLETKGAVAGLGAQVAREEAAIAEKAGLASTRIAQLNEQLRLNAAAQREIIALQRQHRWERIGMVGRALSDVGRTAQYAGGITVIALAAMGREAARFRTQVTLAATQVGNNFNQVQTATTRMMRAILGQMKRFPASAQDMAKSSYDIFSSLQLSGNQAQQTAQGVKVLDLANKAAVAGQANLVDVTHAGITILNDFGRANKDASVNVGLLEKFMNRAFAAVRFGRMTFTEFTQALTTTAPAAKAANQTFDNMSGSLAFLTTRIPSVRTAGIAYARLLEIIQRAGAGLKARGIDIKNTAGLMRPLDQIMKDITDKFPAVKAGRKNALEFFKEVTKGTGTSGTQGTIQARRAFVFLATQQQAYQRILRRTTHDQGEFWKSFRALRASPEVKWRIFVNQLHALSIEIGQYAIPALLKMVGPIAKAVKWFDSLDDRTKKQVAIIAVWTGGLLLATGTLAVLAGTLTRMIGTFATFGKVLGGAKLAEAGLAAEAGFITVETAGLAAVAAGLLYLWIKYPEQVDAVASSIFNLKDASKALHTQIADVKTIVHALTDGVNRVLGPLARFRKSMHDDSTGAGRLTDHLRSVVNWLRRIANFGPVKVTLHFISKGNIPHIPALPTIPNVPGFLRGATDTVRHPFTAAFNAAFPGVQRVNSMIHTAAAISHHFDRDKKSADRFALSLDGVAVSLRRVNRALGRALSIPVSRDPFQQARGGPAVAANAAQMHKEAMRNLKAQKHEQILRNRTVQQWIALAIKANKFAAQHPHNLQAQIRAAQIMNQIQKRFTGAQLEGIQAVISADTSATKKRINNAKQLAKETIDNMKQVYQDFLQKNEAAFGSVVDGVRAANAMEWGAIPKGGDLLADMRDQVTKFERWRAELSKLGGRLPAKLVAQLQEAGPSAEPILRGLLRMTPKQIREYVRLWQRGQADIRRATAVDFNKQLSQWRSHGRRAAIQFMKGMRDEGSFINKEMRRIFLSWMHGGNAKLNTKAGKPTATNKVTHHHHDTINIHGNNEDLSTTHRKARLMQKSRRANRLNWGVV